MRSFCKPTFPSLGLVAVILGCEEVPRTYSTADDGGVRVFRDDFDRGELGPNWKATGPGATVQNGRLQLRNLRNHPLWLIQPLPDDVRIEFDAWATTEEGDIKIELAGDGESFATSLNYIASGYVIIFGGWNNTQNAIVRNDEHGKERVSSDEPTVRPDERYHWIVSREGGEIRWEVNGREILRFDDANPIRGAGHRAFAFSGWEAETHFDNLVIDAL